MRRGAGKAEIKERKQAVGGKTSIVESLKARSFAVRRFLGSSSSRLHHRRLLPFVGFCFLARGGVENFANTGQRRRGREKGGKVEKGKKVEHKCLANGINMSKTQRSACYKQIVLLLPKKYMKNFNAKKIQEKCNGKNKY